MTTPDFSDDERAAVYRAIHTRRDVRSHFVDRAVPADVLTRILEAAHAAPSVGFAQPWRFVVVREPGTRNAVHAAFLEANAEARRVYAGERAEQYDALRLQGIREAPVGICVTSDDAPEEGHGLGRQSMPETVRYSTVCAIQNLWLAARVEGLGVGWVSIIDPDALRRLLAIPAHLTVVAYLCVGYVDAFAAEPDLERAGWQERLAIDDVVAYERYDGSQREQPRP